MRLIALGPESFDVEIFSYVLTPDYDEFLKKQENLLLALLEIVATEGIALAMPMSLNVLSRDTARAPEKPDGVGR